MKNQVKKILSLLIVLAMVFTILAGISVPSSAATYVYNWGTREVECAELSNAAAAFYTGVYVYSDMSNTQGGTGTSNAPSSALYKELQTLMKSKHKTQTSYSATKNMYQYTDCQNGGGKISSFYSGALIGPAWGQGDWNREHTWPNSKGLGGNDENDIMMLRPTSTSENSSRGNTAYGKSSGYYNPNSESGGKYDLRGDVARICLYVYVRWGNTSYMWGKSGVMESLDVLLEWMEADPVDTWEMGRNDSVQSITGTRNIFVDYPEYAWLLFGEDIPSGMTTPSGMAQNGGSGTGSGGTPPDTPTCTHVYANACDTTCNKCGAVRSTTHTYDNACDTTCNICGNIRAVGNHIYTSDSDTTCNICGYTRVIGSNPDTPTDQTPPASTGCKHENVETLGAVDETCVTNGYTGDLCCADCGIQIIEGAIVSATGKHNFEAFGEGEDSYEKCTVCGLKKQPESSSGGCTSSVGGVAVIITSALVGALAFVRKKED